VVTDFSSMPEVAAQGARWLVSGQRSWSGQQAWQLRPNVEQIVEALEAAYGRDRATVRAEAALARDHAERFEVGRVYREHMRPALEQASQRHGLESSLVVAA
jgi:hypothetical protein